MPQGKELLQVSALGAAVGLLTPLVGYLLQKFAVTPLFCHQAFQAICSANDLTAFYVATIITGIMAIALMANWQIFRPLLVAVAAAAALWGFARYAQHTASTAGVEFYATSAALYAVSYALFYWLLRLKSFTLSVVLTVVAVIAIRWALLV